MGGCSMITGVAGVIIWTEDVQRLATFYTDILGLTPFSVRDDSVSFAWGDMRLRIAEHSAVRGCSADPLRVMLNLAVNDIHEAYDVIRGRGVDFFRQPEQEEWGGWVSTLSDPDGNTLQLMQLPT